MSFLRGLTEQTRTPWKGWDLNEEFFESLSRYIVEHPDGRLDRVLDRVSAALEANEDFLSFIPGSPFPAQSLVTALGYLLKLGMIIKRAKCDVFEFVRKVVEWAQAVQSVFESAEHNRFGYLTWRSLRKSRDLINEICSWASTRLEDNRWTRIQNGFRISKEIDEFKACLAETKEIFKDISLLHLDGGMNAILLGIRSILFRQDKILNEIRKIKKQRIQSSCNINEMEEMKRAQVREAFLKDSLGTRTVSNPGYDAQGKSPCDEGTRKAELAVIMQWLNSITPGSQNFLWLTGNPGCGKSTITASVARHCEDEGVLWGQLFINRNNEETTDPNMFFPTIARQLANYSLEVEQKIHDQLKADPTLADRMTSGQAAKLFVDALAVAAMLDHGRVVAVIIDGLDEIDKNCLFDTADVFSRLFNSLVPYPNVKVFVSSRTEHQILKHFSRKEVEVYVKRLHLSTSASIGDVALFMRRQIDEKIVKRYHLKWEEWPTEDGMEKLATRASGLFIWAITAVKYLQVRIDEDGKGCLVDVLGTLTGEALEEVNNLYSLILHAAQQKKKHTRGCEFAKFRQIVGAIIVLKEPLCLDDLSALLSLCPGSTNTATGILNLVRQLRTVLVAGNDIIGGQTIPRLHKSFFEFITNAQVFKQPGMPVDCRFCVDPAVAEAEIALCCLQQFVADRAGKSSTGKSSYAARFCLSHVDAIARQASAPLSVGLVIPEPMITVEGIHTQFSAVQRHSSLTPWFSLILNGSPAPFSRLTSAVVGGRQTLATVESHILCLAYSPNGEQFVSGFEVGHLILWNSREGTAVARLNGHTSRVWSVAFSSSGGLIASGSADNTIRIWDAMTTQLVHVLRGHSKPIFSISFSPVEQVVASASGDRTILLWNAHSGESIRPPFRHSGQVYSVTFTADGNQLVSGVNDGCVYVWNRHTGECQQKLSSIISNVHSVAASPTGDSLVAVGAGGLCFWIKSNSDFVLDERLTFKLGPDSYLFRVAFSPDGKSVVVSDRSYKSPEGLFVYDLSSLSKNSVYGNREIEEFSLSPDGSSAVFSASNKIHIYDIPRHLPVTLTALSPDAEIVVSIFSDGSVWFESPKNLPVVSKHLEGKVGTVKYLTFSSDNAHLAAVDDDFVYLWDISTRSLRGHASHKKLSCIIALSFLADRCTLASTHESQSVYAWDPVDGTLHPRPMNASSTRISFDHQLLLEVDQDHAREIAGARWFPAKRKDSGLWAYVNGTLIRVRRDGTVTLLSSSSS